ncbi:MAG: hypothetical protein L3K16_01460 [Thermoplasmata archaeon]|nr:hypothetical protein [Thermoplasmata archaeon]
MDRERLVGFLAIALLAAAVGAAGIILRFLGLVSLNALAGAAFDAFLGGASVAIAAILVALYPNSRLVRVFVRKNAADGPLPDLRVKPLPHVKGWIRPGKGPNDFILYKGEKPSIGADPGWGTSTHPDRVGQGIHPAQVLELVWPNPQLHPNRTLTTVPGPTKSTTVATLNLKFIAFKVGVLSITNGGGEAEHCSAHARYQVEGDSKEFDVGLLNWYSHAKRLSLKEDDIELEALSKDAGRTINRPLENPYLDIPEEATARDECDLCLFYMTVEPSQPFLYIAAPGWTPIEIVRKGKHPVRVTMKVRFQ